MRACRRVGNSALTQEQPPPRRPPSLVGSFNESQFPTECHITPLNDLIKQSRHLLSPATSLFTTAATAVTQFPPPTPPPSGVRWDQIVESRHLPSRNKVDALPPLLMQHAISGLPTSGRRARARPPPPEPKGPIKLLAARFIRT